MSGPKYATRNHEVPDRWRRTRRFFFGYLLTRAGVDVTVLEKHTDFLRDFRGDTIHLSTMQVLYELDLIPKGGFDSVKAMGLDAFRDVVRRVCPPLKDIADSLTHWSDVKLLSVQINRMRKWYEPGLLFIGDAAHAMSPVGGVGINLAIQDALDCQ